jgi:cob(I)alamin adenosyltransferase
MHKIATTLALFLLLASAMMLTACGSTESGTPEPGSGEQTDQRRSIDEVIEDAATRVGNLAATVGVVESRVDGLEVQADLEQLESDLNDAAEEVGDKKTEAVERLSAKFDEITGRIDTAAGKLPDGGPVRTELEGFSQKLKDVQAELAVAAAAE